MNMSFCRTVIAVDNSVVKSHMDKLASRPRTELDEKCLQWNPGVTNMNKSFLSDEDDEAEKSVRAFVCSLQTTDSLCISALFCPYKFNLLLYKNHPLLLFEKYIYSKEYTK